MAVPPHKRPGRPSIAGDDGTVRVGVSLPARQFDAYAKRALAEDVSVPEVIRRELRGHREAKKKQP